MARARSSGRSRGLKIPCAAGAAPSSSDIGGYSSSTVREAGRARLPRSSGGDGSHPTAATAPPQPSPLAALVERGPASRGSAGRLQERDAFRREPPFVGGGDE